MPCSSAKHQGCRHNNDDALQADSTFGPAGLQRNGLQHMLIQNLDHKAASWFEWFGRRWAT